MIVFSIFIFLANAEHGKGFFKLKSTMFVTFIVIFSLLSIIFTATICALMNIMDKVSEEKTFKKEKFSILLQFFFFLLAFVSRAVFYSLQLYLNTKSDTDMNENTGEGFR